MFPYLGTHPLLSCLLFNPPSSHHLASATQVQFDSLHDVLIHNPKGIPAITKAGGRTYVVDSDGRSWHFDLISRRQSNFCSKDQARDAAARTKEITE